MSYTLDLTHRLHMNGLAWGMDECLRHVREGNQLPSPDLLRVMNALPQEPDRTALGATMLLAATETARAVAPGCLPAAHTDVEVEARLLMDDVTPMTQDLRVLTQEAAQVFGPALTQDQDQLRLALARTPQGKPTALVWAMCLMMIAMAMHASYPGRGVHPSPVLMYCLGCSAVLGRAHTQDCPQARCADTGTPLGQCPQGGCPVTVWEGEPTGALLARDLRLWCVDTTEGVVAVPESHPHGRPWTEEVERISTWDRDKATWV